VKQKHLSKLKIAMAGQSSTPWAHWVGLSEFHGPFERYWKSEPAFSEPTLDKYRNDTANVSELPWPTSRGSQDDLFKDEFPTDPALGLHNTIHTFFQPANFLTRLPLDEVHDVLQPALQLASQFLTNDHALEWFAHNKFSTMLPANSGPAMLIRRANPVIKDKLAIVKKQIDQLVGRVPISFASRIDLCDPNVRDSEACATYDQDEALWIIKATQAKRTMYNQFGNHYRPMIFINIKYFHEAMRLHYSDAKSAEKRCFHLNFTIVLLHEFAHVWTGICHPSARRTAGEPIICPTDAFPEAGFSWEQWMIGAQVCSMEKRGLIATAFASQFVAPRHKIISLVPMSYINKWFLASTWNDFANLHTSGALLAPSPDRNASNVLIGRYCATTESLRFHCYINGRIDSTPCCTSAFCNIRFAHEDPAKLRATLLEVLDCDVKLAKSYSARHGKDVEQQLLGVGAGGGYDHIIERMEVVPLVGLDQTAPCVKPKSGKFSFLKGLWGNGSVSRGAAMVKRDDVFDL
jgi:hypothetical protein